MRKFPDPISAARSIVCCFQPVDPSYRLIAVPRFVHVVPSGEVCTWIWSASVVYAVSWYTHSTADAVSDPAGIEMYAVRANRVLFPLVAVYELNPAIAALAS